MSDRDRLVSRTGVEFAAFPREEVAALRPWDSIAERLLAFQPAANHGDPPWLGAPEADSTPFRPGHICLIYLRLRLAPRPSIDAARFHYPIDSDRENWDDIKLNVATWINFLNQIDEFPEQTARRARPSPTPTPAPSGYIDGSPHNAHKYWSGRQNFAFRGPHHVVIYMKNRGIEYDETWPIWFSPSLEGTVFDLGTASPNDTFYDAHVYSSSAIQGRFAKNLIHFKNYYRAKDGDRYVPVQDGNYRRAYSFNINAIFGSNDDGTWPVIFDPDTGNMGEGQP